jgi:hypothetical protein
MCPPIQPNRSSAGLSSLMPAEVGPVQPRLRRRASRGWGTQATAGPGRVSCRPEEGPRLPQPDPARSRTSRVELTRRPSFPLLISNHADPGREDHDAHSPHHEPAHEIRRPPPHEGWLRHRLHRNHPPLRCRGNHHCLEPPCPPERHPRIRNPLLTEKGPDPRRVRPFFPFLAEDCLRLWL